MSVWSRLSRQPGAPSFKYRSVAPAFHRGLRIKSQAALLGQTKGRKQQVSGTAVLGSTYPPFPSGSLSLSPSPGVFSFWQSPRFSLWRGSSAFSALSMAWVIIPALLLGYGRGSPQLFWISYQCFLVASALLWILSLLQCSRSQGVTLISSAHLCMGQRPPCFGLCVRYLTPFVCIWGN